MAMNPARDAIYILTQGFFFLNYLKQLPHSRMITGRDGNFSSQNQGVWKNVAQVPSEYMHVGSMYQWGVTTCSGTKLSRLHM